MSRRRLRGLWRRFWRLSIVLPQPPRRRRHRARDKDGYVLNWLLCGPFPNTLPGDKADYEHHKKLCWGYAQRLFPRRTGEAAITPRAGARWRFGDQTFAWQKHAAPET